MGSISLHNGKNLGANRGVIHSLLIIHYSLFIIHYSLFITSQPESIDFFSKPYLFPIPHF